jgi:GT2 family glycosyltransferase
MAHSPDTVCAVVVTRDRRALLQECLSAVLAQTRRPDHVLVVDNASSDGTPDLVRSDFPAAELLRLDRNSGGAGGFHAGMHAAHDRGFAWLWLLDDDAIPTADALERLLAPLDDLGRLRRPDILASRVVWTDGDLHPKNLPFPRTDDAVKGELLDAAARRLLLIRAATFVSILVAREAIDRHGLPHRHYYIWGDDGEFTARVLREGAGYLVPDSVVVHKTPEKAAVHEPSPQYYYELRNKLLMLRGDAFRGVEKVRLAAGAAVGLGRYLAATRGRPRALALVARALRDGLVQRPA